MKKIILMILVFMCCVSLDVSVFASEDMEEQIEEALGEKQQSEKKDLKKVKGELQKYLMEAKKSKDESETVSDEESCLGNEQYQYDRAYCVQPVEMFMITEYFKQNNNFDKLIADVNEWRVPYVTAGGKRGVVYLAENGDSFEWMSETDDEQGEETWPEEEEIVSVVKKNLGEENTITDIKYLSNILYALEMVYIKCDNGKYIIPYAEDLEMLNAEAGKVKLKNGKLYTVDEFMKTMNILFDEKSHMNMGDDEVGGGLPYRQPHTMRIVAVVGVLLAALVFFGVRKYRRGHEEVLES